MTCRMLTFFSNKILKGHVHDHFSSFVSVIHKLLSGSNVFFKVSGLHSSIQMLIKINVNKGKRKIRNNQESCFIPFMDATLKRSTFLTSWHYFSFLSTPLAKKKKIIVHYPTRGREIVQNWHAGFSF